MVIIEFQQWGSGVWRPGAIYLSIQTPLFLFPFPIEMNPFSPRDSTKKHLKSRNYARVRVLSYY